MTPVVPSRELPSGGNDKLLGDTADEICNYSKDEVAMFGSNSTCKLKPTICKVYGTLEHA